MSRPSPLGLQSPAPSAQPLCVMFHSLQGPGQQRGVCFGPQGPTPLVTPTVSPSIPHPFLGSPSHPSPCPRGRITWQEPVPVLKELKVQLKGRRKSSENLTGIGFCQENHNPDPLSKCHLFGVLTKQPLGSASECRAPALPGGCPAESQRRSGKAASMTLDSCRSHLAGSGHQGPPLPGVTHGLGTCPESATCLSG